MQEVCKGNNNHTLIEMYEFKIFDAESSQIFLFFFLFELNQNYVRIRTATDWKGFPKIWISFMLQWKFWDNKKFRGTF